MELIDSPATGVIEIDLRTGPGASLAGMRRMLAALGEAGAGFTPMRERCPAEWGALFDRDGSEPPLADIALSASERRLHRESEQTFRVLAAAARALCEATSELERPLLLRGVGGADLVTLRGLIRACEYARATGRGRLSLADVDLVEPVDHACADYRDERARCLGRMNLDVSADDLHPAGRPVAARAGDPESALFAAATSGGAAPVDRLSTALLYCRRAFYSSNWEGMAVVAAACLPLTALLRPADVAGLTGSDTLAGDNQAIEFEPVLLRHPADVRAYLLKVLGVQATFRGRQDDAIGFFRAMLETDLPVSPETRAQSHLYAALTLTKRTNSLDAAGAELESGFAAVAARPDETPSVRRERGWLHNLRALTRFSRRDLVGALEDEKRALDCIDGLRDASSAHLRVNLVSNISVLQETAGKHAQALRTWERFARFGFEGDAKFVKHHAYRAAGLEILAGDMDAARVDLARSLSRCADLADDFHECEVASELGTLLLGDGDASGAERCYEQAAAAATRLGDPYRMALTRVGRAASAGVPVGGAADGALASSTHRRRAAALARAMRGSPARDEVIAVLPRPRTKLNRPFDLINF